MRYSATGIGTGIVAVIVQYVPHKHNIAVRVILHVYVVLYNYIISV